MSQFESRIMQIKNELLIMKFSNELEHIQKSEMSEMIVDDRESLLKKIIENKKLGNIKEEKKPTENSFQNYLDKISQNAYRKPWNSLQKFHKSIKLKEFSCSLTNDKKIQDEIYSKLIISLNNKKINSIKSVNYDNKKETIISITGLEFDKQNSKYTINI